MDVTALAANSSAMAAGRLQLDVATAVLGTALDASSNAALALVAGLVQSVPAGLTYGPNGLEAGATSRVIATL